MVRTMTVTRIEFIDYDSETNTGVLTTVDIPGRVFKSHGPLDEPARKVLVKEGYHPVRIDGIRERTEQRSMTDEDFYRHSTLVKEI